MDRILSALNNKYLVAAVTGLFVLGIFRRFASR
jgi:hypothetical protein